MWHIARLAIPKSLPLNTKAPCCCIRRPSSFFDEAGLKKLPSVKSLQAEYSQLLTDKKAAYGEYRQGREEMRELLTVKANVDSLLEVDANKEKTTQRDPAVNR